MTKFLRRTLTALLIVAGLLTASVVGATVQTFDGTGEWHTSDAESEQMAKARAQQRAQLDAQKKAGLYIKTFSRSINNELADDEISAVTANIIELVGEVHFDKKIIQLSDTQTTILYTATLKARIDPEGIYDFVKRDDKDTIVQRNRQLQDAIQRNDELAASLTEQYNRATSQADKDRIRRQMNDADRDFLANQKFEDGDKLAYAKDFDGAIKFFDEAIRLNPNNADLYNARGAAYIQLQQYEQAIQDFSKEIQLTPNNANAYFGRAVAYADLEQYERAVQDYSKAIKLNPHHSIAYLNRGITYAKMERYERAIQDFSKAVELHPYLTEAYLGRAMCYGNLGQYERAIQDCDRAIQVEPNNGLSYFVRATCYAKLGDRAKAQADLNKASELGYTN